jgi:hypothetical protein
VLRSPKGLSGLTRDYWPVQLEAGAVAADSLRGREVKVEISGFDHSVESRMDGLLIGKILDQEVARGSH